MRNNKMKGFTLVELLVVIAILAILATVSVVGYTSYIEGATVRVDEDLAAQLTRFLEAYKVNNPGEITEDNIWQITQDILEESGVNELNPKALDYGYNFYYNFSTEKYELLKEKDVMPYGFKVIRDALAAGEGLKPGFFDYDGALVFLVNTTGSDLANAVRGFYTFDHIEDADKFGAFQEIVSGLDAAHNNIKNAALNSVFVAEEGTYANGNSATNYVFHAADGIIMEPSVPVTLSSPVKVPANVASFEVGAFNVTYTEDGKLVFEAPIETLKSALCEDSLPNGLIVNIDGNDWTYHSATDDDDAKLTYSTETVYLDIANPLKDFHMLMSGTANKLHNVSDDSVGYDSILVWDGETFTLGLDPSSLTAEFADQSLSSKRVTWKLTDETGRTATYAGVSLVGNVITLSKGDDGLYPTTANFYVTATAAHPMTDGTYASKTFTVVLSRPTSAIFSVDGTATAGNTTANITYAETVDGIQDTFSVTSAFTAGTNTCDKYFAGATYATDFSIVNVNAGVEKTENGVKILSSLFDGNESGNPVATTIKVRIGSYFEHEITLNADNTKYMFSLVNNGNINTLGTEGHAIKPSDLFTTTETFAETDEVKVQAFLKPSRYATIKELLDNPANHLPTQENPQGVWATAQSVDYDGTINFDFDLKDPTMPAQVVFVVTVNGVRASEDYEVDIVNAYNTRDYGEIKSATYTESTTTASGHNGTEGTKTATVSTSAVDENGYKTIVQTITTIKHSGINLGFLGDSRKTTTTVATVTTTIRDGYNFVLLGDITMLGSYDLDNNNNRQDGTLDLRANTTFYGNGYTWNLTGGRISEEGIINLYGKIKDTKVIGNFYSTFGTRAGDDYGSSAICAKGGKSVIENCYVANCRSPLRLSQDATVKDSVFYGGRYSNIDITGGKLTIQGNVVTVNQPVEYESGKWSVGTGIAVWYSANMETTKVEVAEGANLKQFNFIPQNRTDAMPKIMELIDVGSMFKGMIDNPVYESAVFTDDNSVKYLNTGIVFISKDTATAGGNVTVHQNHQYTYASAQYNMEFNSTLWGLVDAGIKAILGSNPFTNPTPFHVSTIVRTIEVDDVATEIEENIALFEESANAVTTYAPGAYELTTK